MPNENTIRFYHFFSKKVYLCTKLINNIPKTT